MALFTDLKDFGKDLINLPNSDYQPVGFAGYVADVRIRESYNMSSDAPDNYVEDGSAVNDHIIVNPITLTIEGEVSNTKVKESFTPDILTSIDDKYLAIARSLYAGNSTEDTIEKIARLSSPIDSAFSSISDAVETGKQFYSFFDTARKKGEIDSFFNFIESLLNTKQVFKVETFFKTYDNMMISSFTPIYSNETDEAVRYSITFKQIRFAETILVSTKSYTKNPTDSTKNKVSSKKNKGTIAGARKSFLSTAISIF